LSRSEKYRVVWEFAFAAARHWALWRPTIVLLDDFATVLDEGWQEKYLVYLSAPEHAYQTVVTALAETAKPSPMRWSGWEIVRLNGKERGVVIAPGFGPPRDH